MKPITEATANRTTPSGAGEHDIDISEENLAKTVACQHMMTYCQTLHDAPDFTFSKGWPSATWSHG